MVRSLLNVFVIDLKLNRKDPREMNEEKKRWRPKDATFRYSIGTDAIHRSIR